MSQVALPLLAGVLTTANPCVLPMLPMLFTGAFAQSRWGPVWLAAGLVASFTMVGGFLAVAGHAIGLDPGVIRTAAAALLLASGLVMVSPTAQAVFFRLATPLAGRADRLAGRLPLDGNRGQLLLGVALGAVWSPCVGPTLGAAVAAAAQGGSFVRTSSTMGLFSLGMAGVFLTLAYTTRGVAARRGLVRVGGARAKGSDGCWSFRAGWSCPDWTRSWRRRRPRSCPSGC